MASEWVRERRLKRAGRDLVLTRRQVLIGTAAVVGAGLLSAQTPVYAQTTGASKPKVVVIGAGFAGLACAYELMTAGAEVQVLEARDRVGGRVFSRTDIGTSGGTVEFGAELIGANHPHWLAYAQRFGLTMRDVSGEEDRSLPVLVNRRLLSNSAVEALYEGMAIAEDALTTACRPIDAESPWAGENAALDMTSVRQFLRQIEMPRQARDFLDREIEADNALPTRQQSLLGMLASIKAHGAEDFWTQTEVYRCEGGNQSLAFKLAEALGPDRLKLETPVMAITSRPQGGAQVTTAAGTVIDADVAVLAVPPSMWGTMRLDPAPGLEMTPQIGVAVKHFTPLSSRPWDQEGKSQYAVTDQMPVMTWDGLDAQGKTEAVLVGFSGGPMAERAAALGAEARNLRHATSYERVYPGLSAVAGRPVFANWPRDPWTRAGYSFPAPGQITRIRGALREGFPHLRFAGEHVSQGWPGFMEGALETGAKLGKQLLSA
jgi:monoamine oxidase